MKKHKHIRTNGLSPEEIQGGNEFVLMSWCDADFTWWTFREGYRWIPIPTVAELMAMDVGEDF